ncbi:MAG: SMP-30/gluconolactonase/LRE family protein, partial [Propionibacteriaceae bacterium]
MDGFEIHDPAFCRMVPPNAPLVKLRDGFAWLEGPVWFADSDCL